MQKIKYIHVFGMQCSGTNHLEKTLLLNIPKTAKVEILGNVIGWKHDDIGSRSGITDDRNTHIIHDERAAPETLYNSLIIVVYRSPLTWLQSFHMRPHHAPKLYGLEFSTFIHRPFESYFSPIGHDLDEDEAIRKATIRKDRFWERYPSLYAMRETKINIFESFKFRAPNVCYVNLETLNLHTKEVIQAIAGHYDIPLKQKFQLDTKDKHSNILYAPKQYAHVSREDYSHILKSLNLKAEKNIGYNLRTAFRPIVFGGVVPRGMHTEKTFLVNHLLRMFSHERGDRQLAISRMIFDKIGDVAEG